MLITDSPNKGKFTLQLAPVINYSLVVSSVQIVIKDGYGMDGSSKVIFINKREFVLYILYASDNISISFSVVVIFKDDQTFF